MLSSPNTAPANQHRWWIVVLVGILALFVAHWIALVYRVQPSLSLWFVPSGVAIALTFWFGPIGAILAGAAGIMVAPLWGHTGWSSLVGAADAVEPLVAWMLYRYAWQGSLTLKRLKDAAAFILSVPLSACILTALLSSLLLGTLQRLPETSFSQGIVLWWLGNALGAFSVTPALLLLLTPLLQQRGLLSSANSSEPVHLLQLPRYRSFWLEALPILAVLISTALLTVWKTGEAVLVFQQFSFLSFVPIVWAATRFGATGGILTSSFCVLVTFLSYLLSYGDAFALDQFPIPEEVLSVHTLSLLVQCAVGLLVGTAITERAASQVALAVERVRLSEYEARAQMSEQLIRLNHSLSEANACLENSNLEKDELLRREQAARSEAESAREQVSQILESITDGFVAVDREWRFTYINAEGARNLGCTREALLGKNVWAEFPDLEHTNFGRLCKQAMSEGITVEDEGYYPPFNAWFSVRGYPSNNGFSLYFKNVTDRKQTQEALRKSEERFRVALQGSSIIVFSQDLELRHNWIYNPHPDMAAEFILGKTDREILPLETAERVTAIKRSVIEQGIRARTEVEIEINGQITTYDVALEPLRSPGGNVVGLTGAATNITERKQAEQILRESEERFRQLAENIDVVFFIYEEFNDVSPGQVIYVSPSYEKVWGRSPQQLYANSQGWLDAIHPDDQARIRAALMGFARAEFDEQFRVVQPNGETRWVHKRIFPIYDPQGHLYRIAGIVEDISERKWAEEALQASELLYRTLGEAVPDFVWSAGANEQVDYVNLRWVDYTGTRLDQLNQSGAVAQLIHPDDLRAHRRRWRQAKQSKEPFEVELRLQRHDGEYRWFMGRAVPLKDNAGKLIRWIGSATDIHALKQAEVEREELLAREQAARAEAEAANRAKDEFLAILSHELRSPLNPILGWAKLLRTRHLDPSTVARAVETIERNANLQTQLIEDLLDISRILRGKLSLDVSPVNLVPVIEAAMETMQLAADAKSIDFRFWITDFGLESTASHPADEMLDSLKTQNSKLNIQPSQYWVIGDANRLQQVIWNLLSNAIKFTAEGGRVTIRLGCSDAHAQIQISDTGKGIRADFLPYIFDYFRQADGSITRRHGGLGIGLAIVRHLVELHGGTVTAASPGEEQGATFTVRIPLMASAPEIRSPIKRSEPFPSLQNLKILVVDDEADTREFLTFMLEKYGATVFAVASARAALDAIAAVQPDLLLSDIGMANVDGYELIRQVRTLAPAQGGQLPAIALTAHASEQDQQLARSAGFDQHIAKPVEPGVLVGAIVALVTDR
ncbi:PAS domain S-box protein [Leptolyngbya sp. FACHB-671]|uniref:PAS domain S-box protein n=1 Tax=Leptolyngbya sp. FACHB-671 TaxID=2692812 RepID=UPI0016844691|nr:PAS domain S-box protein [Leptolyngbya sp. FACHB-671]MBD2067935.1 PAS domain S-box protein [Leptolyngbya sp. FACHB-671]